MSNSNLNRPSGRLLLANAFRAAWYFDASEAAHDRLIQAGSALEALVGKAPAEKTRDEHEAGAMAAWRRSGKPVTVDGLMGLAIERVARSLAEDKLDLKVEYSGLVLLPPGTGYIRPPGDGPVNTFEKPRIADRARALVGALIENGMFKEDMVIRVGDVPPGSMRSQGYTYIGLPRYDREILVCDEVGNASFVGRGMRGEAFWGTYSKEHLKQFPDITRVVNQGDTEARILGLVLNDNPVQPKDTVARMPKRPLTNDIVLIHMLRHAEIHGQLPSLATGPVETLPGENWHSTINMAYFKQNRGLGLDGLSLLKLTQLYGLKNGRNDNPEVIAAALKSLRETGQHNLTRRDSQEHKISLPLILTHCLYQAIYQHDASTPADGKRNYILPGLNDGQVQSMPGQSFANFNMWIRKNTALNSINDLYRAAGLMFESLDNPETVRAACERLRMTGEHGLSIGDPEQGRLTLDKIIIAGLRHAQVDPAGQLPSEKSGDVIGYPGQTWIGWVSNVRKRPAYWIDNQPWTSIGHIFRRFGLKIGNRTVPERVAEGLANLERTGHHGLKPLDAPASPEATSLPRTEIAARRPAADFVERPR